MPPTGRPRSAEATAARHPGFPPLRNGARSAPAPPFRPQLVDIEKHWPDDEAVRSVPVSRIVSYDTPAGSAAAYYPETSPPIPLDSTALESNTPTSKSVIVRLLPAGQGHERRVAAASQGQTGSDWTRKFALDVAEYLS